jgi:hypothetical protein
MLRKLKTLFKSRKVREADAQIAELRVAVAGLLAAGKTPEGAVSERNDIDAVLVHAASARIEMDRLSALYEASQARVADLEARVEALEKKG